MNMSFDISKVVEALGEEAIGQIGDPIGLDKEQSVRVARALAAHSGLGNQQMVQAAAADTGLDEEVVAAMGKKLVEEGGNQVMEATGVNTAIDNAKQDAMAALGNVGGDAARNAGGLLGKLFGRR
jgi:hypothetical protein